MKATLYVADQNPKRDRSLGITGYTDGLIRGLAGRKEIDLTTLGSQTSYVPSEEGVLIRRIPIPTDVLMGRVAADNLHHLFYQIDADLWHYPKGYLPVAGQPRKPVIGTVHDLIVQYCADHYPQARSTLAYRYWIGLTKRSLPRFDHILTVSKFSEAAIREFCLRYRLKCPPITVTYEGFRVERSGNLLVDKEDKVVHLASQELHKGTSTLVEFWKKLQSLEKNLPTLKLIGPLPARDRRIAEGLANVHLSDRLSRKELEKEMASARALLLCSEIEGFGLPSLEAYLLGTPTVYVEATAVEEILGAGTPGGFTLRSFDSFRAALEEVLRMEGSKVVSKAQELRERFAWGRCVEKTIAAYRTLF